MPLPDSTMEMLPPSAPQYSPVAMILPRINLSSHQKKTLNSYSLIHEMLEKKFPQSLTLKDFIYIQKSQHDSTKSTHYTQ